MTLVTSKYLQMAVVKWPLQMAVKVAIISIKYEFNCSSKNNHKNFCRIS